MRRAVRRILIAVLVFVVAIQFVPVDRSNPAESSPIREPEEVVAVLERSCFDCHSYRTRWPWYAYVAPVSWLVAYDVHEGRSHVNFSEWGTLDPEKRERIREEVWEEVEEGHMPPWTYLLLHPGARPDDAARGVLRAWAGRGAREHSEREDEEHGHEH